MEKCRKIGNRMEYGQIKEDQGFGGSRIRVMELAGAGLCFEKDVCWPSSQFATITPVLEASCILKREWMRGFHDFLRSSCLFIF
jgi:hypothetical protein